MQKRGQHTNNEENSTLRDNKKRNPVSEVKTFRRKAKYQLKNKAFDMDANSSEEDIQKLIHELQVHRIELEMQNEELVLAKEQIAAAAVEKYKELYDFAPAAYFTLSKEGHISELSLNGAVMLGDERKNLIDQLFRTFLSTDSLTVFDSFLREVFSGETVETCEATLKISHSEHSCVYLTGHVIDDGDQCLLSVIDITQRKKAEYELQNKMDELTRAYKQLEEFSFHIQQLKQFAYISSHELQQPVRTIYNFIQIFENEYSGILDEKAHKYLDIIKDSAKRMYSLITTLSDYSRLGLNKKLRLVNFKELIDNVISDLDAAIRSKGAIIEVSEMPVINAYEIEIHQVFLNLIGNAIKFHKKDHIPVVRVKSEKYKDSWKFSISDNGIGIPPSNYGKLFNMFQRLHSDESEFEGKGIGLTICKKLVELHQGQIWVESNDGQGVTFCFTIPDLSL
jgi:chemotaxis family two-component system sensor kinase Cph1